MSYQLFYWIHVVSSIIWLVGFLASMYFAFKVKGEIDAVKKRNFMQAERKATGIGAHLGALGILISGGAIASLPTGPQWGWFNLQLYPWLTVKQILFVLILVLIGFSIKRSVALKKHLRNEVDVLNSASVGIWERAYKVSFAVYILVVVSTILALYKPF